MWPMLALIPTSSQKIKEPKEFYCWRECVGLDITVRSSLAPGCNICFRSGADKGWDDGRRRIQVTKSGSQSGTARQATVRLLRGNRFYPDIRRFACGTSDGGWLCPCVRSCDCTRPFGRIFSLIYWTGLRFLRWESRKRGSAFRKVWPIFVWDSGLFVEFVYSKVLACLYKKH